MAQLDLKNADVFLQDGYSGSVTGTSLINHVLADPDTAPTATATGGGASGGLLTDGEYLLSYTYVTTDGETLRSPDSATLTVAATNIPRVTFPALPTGAVSRTLYVSAPGGNRASEEVYATGITTLTYDMAIAAPASVAPPVTSTAGWDYPVGTTTMLIDGSTGAVTTGDRFSVDAGDDVYVVTSHIETLGVTTSITFTPALVAAADNNDPIVWLPHKLQIRIGEGNCSWTEKRPVMYTKDRGRLDTVKLGDEEPIEVKLDFTWVFLKADTGETPSIEDAFKKRGEASTWVSSSDDLCEPYAVDIIIEYTPPCTTQKMEIYTLTDFRYEELGHDLKQAQVSVSGKCNVIEAGVARVTQ